MKSPRLFFLFIFLWVSFPGMATHLVGGEINYQCLGNNTYEFTLIIYRDCRQGNTALDPQVAVSIYDQSNTLVANEYVVLQSTGLLPLQAPSNCTVLPTNLCTEKGIYTFTKYLPPIAGGYTISHQRCCRNHTITNINNPGTWGSTFTTSIPSMDTTCNSSPQYKIDPPVVLCLNMEVTLDLSATDADGDSVYYELCSALHGGSSAPSNPAPDPSTPPPYTVVPYSPGFTVTNPISGSPPFTIDHATGMLSGTPSQIGQFVFAICANEYRNGVKMSSTRRDFQFNVSADCQGIISKIRDQDLDPDNICSGGLIKFKNLSMHATSYFWDFGDPTTMADTSNLKNPNYFYPDTGRYQVTLIADPGSTCADTSINYFDVYDSIQINFTYSGELCLPVNKVDFFSSGPYTDNATFLWDFGGNTNLGTTSTDEFPQNVSWSQMGTYYVTLTVTDNGCPGVIGDSIDIFPNPVIDETVLPAQECSPYTVQFLDNSTAYGSIEHIWSFGDGEISYEPSPVHTYLKPGTYSVTHSLKTLSGCLDSVYSIYEDIITIYPLPRSDLKIDSHEKTIYDPVFYFTNLSTDYTHSETYLPDDRIIYDLREKSILIEDTGTFPIVHISYNEYGCSDTLIDSIRVDIPFNLFVPNAFTPNEDGINDLFTFKIMGISSMKIEIYNRWGGVIYESVDPQAGWNGTLNNHGKLLPIGVYSYVIVAEVKRGAYTHTERGVINLVR